jgi:flagellar hook-associated protein 3
MRVTNNMMMNNAIRWIAQQATTLNDCEEVVSAGKQINKPSDNPNATGQILADRTTISEYAQYMSNITDADTWISASNTTLDSVSTLLTDAKSSITSESSWSSSSVSSTLEYLQQLYNEIVDLANTKLSSTYLYGGNNATKLPFTDTVSISGKTASDIIFGLAGSASSVSVKITDASGNIVRTLTPSSGVERTNAITWDGCDDGGNLLSDGSYNFTVTASDSSGNAVAEYTAYRGNTGRKTIILGENSTCTLNNDGGTIFSQALSSLSEAITALKNDSYSTSLASALGTSLKKAITQIQSEQVALSNVESQMTATNTRLTDLTTTIKSELSTVETGSIETASVKLTTQETNYEAAMAAISSVLKMSKLTSFLS